MIAEMFPELLQSFSAYAPVNTRDAYGESVLTWPATATLTFDGALRQLTGDARFVASMHGYDADHRLYVDAPLAIEVGYRVALADQDFEVVAVNPVMGLGELLHIDLREKTYGSTYFGS